VTDIASLFVWRRGHVVVVAITGEVDISNARELETEIVAALPDGDGRLVIDLGGLTFLDAAGVHLLYRLGDRVPHFALIVASDSTPWRVLELSGTRPRRWMHTSEDDAVRAVA
jgi:stage II sporulation protein AA (anti-sigma F factor antagonist)